MPDFPKYDWNTVAAGMQFVPDEAIRMVLDSAPGAETLYSTWEAMWKQSFAVMGVHTDDLALQGRMIREVMMGFYRAEAMRRGL